MRDTLGTLTRAIACCALLLSSVSPAAASPAAASEGCPNEARRTEQSSTFLPDCRAYEQVTPPVKGMGEPWVVNISETRFAATNENGDAELLPLQPTFLVPPEGARASLDGERMAFLSDPMPSAGSFGIDYMATRSASGWRSADLVPPMSVTNDMTCPLSYGVAAWSSDLSRFILDLPAGSEPLFLAPSECGHDEPRLVAGEPEYFRNLFLHDTETGSNRLVNVTPAGVLWPQGERVLNQGYWPASFLAGSEDLSHAVFEEELPLTAQAEEVSAAVREACEKRERGCWEGQDNLYEWSAGQVRLVTVLPGGAPVHGSLAGATRNYEPASGGGVAAVNLAQFRHAVSANGSRVFFEAPGDEGEGDLYLREDGARTIEIDAGEAGCGSCASGGGNFQAANAEGTRVFFTDEERLTAGSTAVAGKPDLYEWRSQGTSGCTAVEGCLSDLTVSASEPAGVLGVAGASEDGSYLYFAAQANLTGSQQNSHGDTPLSPATGSGSLIGPAWATGNLTEGSDRITAISGASGPFALGEELWAFPRIPSGTTIVACAPSCSAPSELTLSNNAIASATGETFHGEGSREVIGLSTASGTFEAGMGIGGTGIAPGTWIAAAGAGTLTLSSPATATGTEALSTGAANLYVRHAGATTFIASLSRTGDECDWTWNAACADTGLPGHAGLTARTATSGAYLGFNSVRSLTGYDNADASTGQPDLEIYRYDAAANRLSCASCLPSGARPRAGAAIHWAARPDRSNPRNNAYPQRNVSDRGQVFFETADALVSADTNGRRDVYEWEQPGVGSCTTAASAYSSADEGCLYLVSKGSGEAGSYFLDATPDGSSVFFGTSQSLLASDVDRAADVYVAREGGGFASQSETVLAPACKTVEECRSPLSEPPAQFLPGSAALSGAGNLAAAPERPAVRAPAKKLTRKQKLARALKACRKVRGRRRRMLCERSARKRFGGRAAGARRHDGGAAK